MTQGIGTYHDLLFMAGEYSGRDDFAQMFPRFVAFVEQRLNKRLRVGGMEKCCTLTTNADGCASLPSDFLEQRIVKDTSGNVMKQISPEAAADLYANRGGCAVSYVISGNVLTVRPAGIVPLSVNYYGAIPALTNNNPQNFLLTDAPLIYLYGVLAEIYGWAVASGRDDSGDKGAAASKLAEAEITAYESLDRTRRYSDLRMIPRGAKP